MIGSGSLPLSTTALSAATAAGTGVNPPELRPSYNDGELLNVVSDSTRISDEFNATLTIVPDVIKRSYQQYTPSFVPNGTTMTYNIRTTTYCPISLASMNIPCQFSVTDQAGAAITPTNINGILKSIETAGFAGHTTKSFDYAFNKPAFEWFRLFQTLQFRGGSSNTDMQSYSNHTYPSMLTNGVIPKINQKYLNTTMASQFFQNMANSRNGNNSSTLTATPWTFTAPTDPQVITNQILQQGSYTDTDPMIQDSLLADMLQSAITQTPLELNFPLKMFVAMFNLHESVYFPPNFPLTVYVNFTNAPFIVRSFGNIKLKCQPILNGATSNVSYPQLFLPTVEFTAEGTAQMNARLLGKYINFSYFEGKDIPPSNPIIPSGSSAWQSQLTIASVKPTAYVMYPIIENPTDGSFSGGREVFSYSPFDGIYWQRITMAIGGYEVVLFDRTMSTNNFRFITRDSHDYHQNYINAGFMQVSNHLSATSKTQCFGAPLYFVVDPAEFVTPEQTGVNVGPVTTQISATFQEYNPTTKALTNTTAQYKVVCYEILHQQAIILPTLELKLISPGAKLDGTAPRATQPFAQNALPVRPRG